MPKQPYANPGNEPNLNEYVKCPHCAMSYKGKSVVNKQAMAGHIALKHKDNSE